jgi:hypothetical protein
MNKMDNLMIVVIAVVVFCYFGGKYCPILLKQNKEMLLGFAIGLVVYPFVNKTVEGITAPRCANDNSDITDMEGLMDCIACSEQRAAANGPSSTPRKETNLCNARYTRGMGL